MNKSGFTICILTILLPALFFSACSDDFENYSSNPNDLLAFSTDTIAFDTIITTVNTPYRLFKVYNPHSKALLISSVSLENGKSSNFKINVDGRVGATFENIEIRGKDSLFVFVDAKPAKNGSNTPEYVSDRIVFITNGVMQNVLLEASTQDAVIWKGFTISSNSVLSNLKPFVIYDSLVIDKGITVELKAGTTFYMHGNAEIIVKGTLKARGTRENPILVRGDRFDYLVNIPYDLVPGQWGGIRFESDSYYNELDYVRIRNGKYGMDFKLSNPLLSKMKMKNVVLTNFKGVLINALNCNIEAENCEFSNARGALLRLIGGQYSFIHCTIANRYFGSVESGWGSTDNETVHLLGSYLNEETEDVEYYPISKADFKNSIIWGKTGSSAIFIEKNEKSYVSHYFQNCIIPNADATNDDERDLNAEVVNCLINIDPKFKKVDSNDYVYDFRLDSISPARNKANAKISERIPLDMNGIDRFLDEAPDIGAYEWEGTK
jgi:hypothetical protein